MSCNSEYIFGMGWRKTVRGIPTKEMTLKFSPERTDRASLAMNQEKRLPGNRKTKAFSRNELVYVRNIKKANLEGEVRKEVKIEMQGLLALI